MVTVRDCQDKVLWQGKTDANGIARIERPLSSSEELPHCEYRTEGYDYPQMGALESLRGGLFVMAQTSEDMAFVHSSWDNGIEPWRFNVPEESYSGPFLAHTLFDRTLLRAGETVHMKHFFRQHTTKGFSLVSKPQTPRICFDRTLWQWAEIPISIEVGSQWNYRNDMDHSQGGKTRFYEVRLLKKSETEQGKTFLRKEPQEWTSGRFRVEEFRVPLLRGMIQPPTDPLINARDVTLDLSVQYLAGGGAGFASHQVA